VSLKDVMVSVYDVAGRELNRLVVGDLAPGAHRVTWDGRAEDGRLVASGIYYCVGSYAGGGSTAERLVVVR
jgi:flagellar hook assembly protein FlgD